MAGKHTTPTPACSTWVMSATSSVLVFIVLLMRRL